MRETDGTLVLSNNTLYQLYLIDTKEHRDERYSSVLSLVNRCQSAVGRRLCKERLLYPIIDTQKLYHRYQCIDQYRKEDRYESVRTCLRNVNDIERLFRKMSLGLLTPLGFVSMHQCLLSILQTHEWVVSNISPTERQHNENYMETIETVKQMIDKYDMSMICLS